MLGGETKLSFKQEAEFAVVEYRKQYSHNLDGSFISVECIILHLQEASHFTISRKKNIQGNTVKPPVMITLI